MHSTHCFLLDLLSPVEYAQTAELFNQSCWMRSMQLSTYMPCRLLVSSMPIPPVILHERSHSPTRLILNALQAALLRRPLVALLPRQPVTPQRQRLLVMMPQPSPPPCPRS